MSKHTTVGLDLAKNSFAVVVLNGEGRECTRKTLRRRQLLGFIARQPEAVVAMEACASAHHLARALQAQGHRVVLSPACEGVSASDYNDGPKGASTTGFGRCR